MPNQKCFLKSYVSITIDSTNHFFSLVWPKIWRIVSFSLLNKHRKLTDNGKRKVCQHCILDETAEKAKQKDFSKRNLLNLFLLYSKA